MNWEWSRIGYGILVNVSFVAKMVKITAVVLLLFSCYYFLPFFFWIWNSNLSCSFMSFVTMWDHLVQNLWYHALSNFHFFYFEWFSSNVILNSISIFFQTFKCFWTENVNWLIFLNDALIGFNHGSCSNRISLHMQRERNTWIVYWWTWHGKLEVECGKFRDEDQMNGPMENLGTKS